MIVGHLERICENTILGVLQLPEEQKMSNMFKIITKMLN